jgi:hypothetical protein
MTPFLGHAPLFGSNLAIAASAWERLRETVHRDVGALHDDLDISFHIEPDMRVRYDPTLRVGISARPFGSWRGLARRLYWSYTTTRLNTRELSAAKRRAERRAVHARA